MSAESSWSDKLWFSFQRVGSVKGEAQACRHGWGMFPAAPLSKRWVREERSNKGRWKRSEASEAQLIMSRYVKLSRCKDASHCQLSLLMASLLYMWLVSQLVNKQICKPWLRLKAKGEPAKRAPGYAGLSLSVTFQLQLHLLPWTHVSRFASFSSHSHCPRPRNDLLHLNWCASPAWLARRWFCPLLHPLLPLSFFQG